MVLVEVVLPLGGGGESDNETLAPPNKNPVENPKGGKGGGGVGRAECFGTQRDAGLNPHAPGCKYQDRKKIPPPPRGGSLVEGGTLGLGGILGPEEVHANEGGFQGKGMKRKPAHNK